MKKYGVNELRELYLSFFESKGHLRMKSFSLVPENDKSLLLINAGMAPLKPYFTGQEVPPRKRVTTCQKCIRTGDIENVGITARHGTFFEMLGNFSFGDYFKKEALEWSWEFLTKTLGIPEDRLYPSIYEEDEEAFEIWHHQIHIPKERIYRFGKEDNFWEHGAGPCGPCSEIYFDRGEKYGCGKPTCAPGCECDRFVEIWNNVFTQFEGDGEGHYTELAQKNIDTGMGLERLAVAMQDVESIFDVDTIRAIREKVCELSHKTYGQKHADDVSIRVITDHVRSVTFMASDGILPSNEGRGYVFRRLLRRACRHGRLLGIDHTFLVEVARVVMEASRDAYPELEEKWEYIEKVLTTEEDSFYRTLDAGLNILSRYLDEAKESQKKTLAGEDAFKLYDTYGFPLDLTREIAQEAGMTVDEEGFKEAMELQKKRAREAREVTSYSGRAESVFDQLDPAMQTRFTGYDHLAEKEAKVLGIVGQEGLMSSACQGECVTVFTDITPFYATKGGQVGDLGRIEKEGFAAEVLATDYYGGDKIGHRVRVLEGELKLGDSVSLFVDEANRMATCRNHSVTHLLQKALRMVLGTHVEQSGSYVDGKYLRFDFTHFEAMTKEQLMEVELEVNRQILSALPIETKVMSLEEAKATGAMALFGEKYGNEVRVVRMGGDYSIELCGGTHLQNTAQAGSFKLISESGIAAGVRRIEAITGMEAVRYYGEKEKELQEAEGLLKARKGGLTEAVRAMLAQNRELSKALEKAEEQLSKGAAESALKEAEKVGDFAVLQIHREDADPASLKMLGDQLKDKLGEGVVLLSCGKEKLTFVAMATDGAVQKGANAGLLVKEAAVLCGGGGGGKPAMAQAGGKDPSKLEEALKAQKALAIQQLQG